MKKDFKEVVSFILNVPELVRVFIFRKINGSWRMFRYMMHPEERKSSKYGLERQREPNNPGPYKFYQGDILKGAL